MFKFVWHVYLFACFFQDSVNFLCDAPEIRAVSFVGGNAAGHHIHRRASANGKRVQSNMGAKNHATIMPDADKESTLNALAGAGKNADDFAFSCCCYCHSFHNFFFVTIVWTLVFFTSAFGAAGQRCMALSTAIFVGKAKEWIPELKER